jgi:hypothetical protein
MLHSDILYNDVGTRVSTDSKTYVAFSKKKRKYFGTDSVIQRFYETWKIKPRFYFAGFLRFVCDMACNKEPISTVPYQQFTP